MLAPGEFLLLPALSAITDTQSLTPLGDTQPVPVVPAPGVVQSSPPAAPRGAEPKPEPRSFLLILLSALGAIHT